MAIIGRTPGGGPSVLLVALALSATLGCGGSADGRTDGEPCVTALRGTEPFGRRLEGRASFIITTASERGEVEDGVALDAYFPDGRVDGAPVFFGLPTTWPRRGFHLLSATVLGDLGSTELTFGGSDGRDISLRGSLLGPEDGLLVDVTRNFASSETDVAEIGEARLRLCPSAELPTPTLTPELGLFAPTAALWLTATALVDPATLDVTATVGGAPIPVDASWSEGLRVVPSDAFPPGAVLAFDLGATADLIGRPFTLAGALPMPLVTTAVVTDTTFAAEPPEGAVVVDGANVTTTSGFLSVSQDWHGSFQLLVALPDGGGATRARVRFEARGMGSQERRAALVAADGTASYFEITDTLDSGSPIEQEVLLPGAGPLWLSISVDDPPDRPQSYAGFRPVEIGFDAITYE